MADQTDGFLREIDEELRQEHYEKLWKRYGKYVIGAAVALVVTVAGYQTWRSSVTESRRAEGERFAAALILAQSDKTQEAERALAAIAADGGAGYAMLARFRAAAVLSSAGDHAGARAAFSAIADGGAPERYRGLARMLAALQALAAGAGDLDAVSRALEPLMADDGPWRHSAREMAALITLEQGNTGQAREQLNKLADDATAPGGVRARARELLESIGQ